MAHFDSVVSTLAYVVKITRIDGIILGMTSLNFNLAIDGVTYTANSAVDPTAVTQKVNLSTDNIQLKALIESNQVTAEDLLNGKYENAEVICALVDFMNLPSLITDGIVLLQGRVGEVEVADDFYTFEVRSLSEELARPLTNKASTVCPYEFGDSSTCQLNLALAGYERTGVNVSSGAGTRVFIDTVLNEQRFIGGVFKFTSGVNAGKEFEIREINGSEVRFTTTFTGIVGGSTANITGFCPKTEAGCIERNNHINFGGFLVGGRFMPGLSRITVVQ